MAPSPGNAPIITPAIVVMKIKVKRYGLPRTEKTDTNASLIKSTFSNRIPSKYLVEIEVPNPRSNVKKITSGVTIPTTIAIHSRLSPNIIVIQNKVTARAKNISKVKVIDTNNPNNAIETHVCHRIVNLGNTPISDHVNNQYCG